MMFRRKRESTSSSRLYSQDTFYKAFFSDLRAATSQVIIESPFITTRRANILMPVFQQLRKRGVQIVINTKPLYEHEPMLYAQAQNAITMFQELGILVLLTTGHHRKLAIIDRQTLWEGSLNILSQYDSCEIMRRIDSTSEVEALIKFIGIQKYLKDDKLC